MPRPASACCGRRRSRRKQTGGTRPSFSTRSPSERTRKSPSSRATIARSLPARLGEIMAETVEIDNLGIPPLAGVCSYEEAARPGLAVDRAVTRLKRLNYVGRRLHETAAAHLPHTPEWEVKCALGLHLWLDAEHCSAIRMRVGEMREPPLHLDAVPDERLEA